MDVSHLSLGLLRFPILFLLLQLITMYYVDSLSPHNASDWTDLLQQQQQQQNWSLEDGKPLKFSVE